MDYKELVVKSWKLIWRHKWLWIFGFFAASGGGGGGGFNSSGTNFSQNNSEMNWDQASRQAAEWISQNIGLIVAVALVFFVFILVMSVLSFIARGALIGAADRLDRDEEATFGNSFSVGTANFWSLLGLSLLLGLIVFLPVLLIIGLIIGGVFMAMGGMGAGVGLLVLLAIPLILVLIPAFIILNLLGLLGARAVVVDGLGAVAALGSAWRLFWRRLGPIFLSWLIMLGIGIGFGIGFFIVLLSLLVPGGLAAFLIFKTGFSLVKLAVTVFFGFIILAAILTVAAAFSAYSSVYWTLAYRQITGLDAKEAEPQPAAS